MQKTFDFIIKITIKPGKIKIVSLASEIQSIHGRTD
jgi:hypothetical protein